MLNFPFIPRYIVVGLGKNLNIDVDIVMFLLLGAISKEFLY